MGGNLEWITAAPGHFTKQSRNTRLKNSSSNSLTDYTQLRYQSCSELVDLYTGSSRANITLVTSIRNVLVCQVILHFYWCSKDHWFEIEWRLSEKDSRQHFHKKAFISETSPILLNVVLIQISVQDWLQVRDKINLPPCLSFLHARTTQPWHYGCRHWCHWQLLNGSGLQWHNNCHPQYTTEKIVMY